MASKIAPQAKKPRLIEEFSTLNSIENESKSAKVEGLLTSLSHESWKNSTLF